jgi:zinc protease
MSRGAFERTRILIAAALVVFAFGSPAEARHHQHHQRAAAPAATAPRDDQAVLRARLPNGLRVIIVRNTLAPVVATSVNYLVGSDDAPNGFPGTAHALEHMMFRGSPGLSADQLANIGALMGGDFNANTRGSLTQYLYTVPAEDVDVALNIEALRMKGLDSTDAEWAKERGAIEQEVAQDQSAPGYKLYERLRSELFAGTPYEHDALGNKPSFEKTSGADLKAFHAKWYAPNNAILVLVGNVDPKATLTKIKSLFGAIPSRRLPARAKFAFKPVKPGMFTIDSDYPNYTRVLAMRFPGLKSKDFPALEVLADVLSSRRFALYGLVAEGKALGAEFSLEPLPQASIAYAAVSYAPGSDGNALEARVREILEKVARDGVPAELVEAAKLQERRSGELQKNSIADLASDWSDAVALYGLKSPDEDWQRIEKVTVEDVNRVAREYLKLDASLSGLLLPKGSGKPVASSNPTGGMETINLGEAKPVPLPDWANAAVNRLDVPETTLAPVDTTLPNGLRLIVQPTKVSDTVNVYGHIRNRAETQMPPGKDGVNILLGALFNFGTEKLDRLAFEKELDAIGAQERGGADFALHVLSQDFDRGVELLAQHQLQPALPQEALTAILPQIAQSVESRNHTPGYLAQRAMVEALFAPDDPSRREATGATVIGLKRADVLAYYKSVFRPDMTTIVVIGNVTPEKAKEVIAKYFGAWTAEGPKPAVDLPVPPANKAAQVAVPDDSRVQDSVLLAQNLAPKRTDPDYYALSLGNQVLGGGFYSTRLSIDLRKNAGLVYSVGSSLQSGRTRGNYYVQYACDPENVGKAAAIVVQNLKTMQEKPVPQEELDRVKAMVLRQLPLGEASVDDIAHGFIDRVEYDLPLDESTLAAKKYAAMTAAEVQAAFGKWIRPNDLVRITQGPAPK